MSDFEKFPMEAGFSNVVSCVLTQLIYADFYPILSFKGLFLDS
jgi:hypothetical protein